MAVAPTPALDREALTRIVARALGQPVELGDWTVSPVGCAAFNPVSQGLYRVSGSAPSGVGLPWSVVLKICRALSAADLAQARADDRERMLEVLRWDREADAYGSGLLATLPAGLAAPRCLEVERRDGSAWIWLEHVADERAAWDVERYALAARHLGRFNGEYLAGRSIPAYPWLSRRWLHGWTAYFTRTGRALLADDRVWAQRLSMELFGPEVRADLLRLSSEFDQWWLALDALPLTLSHLDAFRANLLSRTASHGIETVAVDWSFVGAAPFGAEVAHLVLASAFYHGDPADPYELADRCLRGYADGLSDAGYSVGADELRRAYVINAVTRWLFIFGPLAAIGDPSREQAVAERRGMPFRDVLAPIASKTRYLCALAREVRDLAF